MKRYDPQVISDTLRFSQGTETKREAASEDPNPPDHGSAFQSLPSDFATGTSASELLKMLSASIPSYPADRIRKENLPCIDGSVPVGRVPPGASFGFFKRIFMRFLRIITARQMDFNWHTAYVLRALNEHAEKMGQGMNQMAQQIAAAYAMAHKQQEAFQQQENRICKIEENLESLRLDVSRIAQDIQQRSQTIDECIQDMGARVISVDSQFSNTDGRFQAIEQHLELVRSVQNQIIESMGERSRTTADMIDSLRSSQRRMLRVIQNDLDKIAQEKAEPASVTDSIAQLPPEKKSALLDDLAYQLYEDTWRGSTESIRKSQNEYIDILMPHLDLLLPDQQVVLDIGCGRGEFLEALKTRGYRAMGVDTNQAFVQLGRESGQQIHLDDANHFLNDQPDNSFGGIVAFQVLEHLEISVLRRFMNLIYDKLAPGGVALFETLNPSVFSAYQWFFMDLSHQRFLPPQTLRFVGECSGLEHIETRLIHPVADYAKLQETGDEQEKENIRRLNTILFGPQDYFILFRKPAVSEI